MAFFLDLLAVVILCCGMVASVIVGAIHLAFGRHDDMPGNSPRERFLYSVGMSRKDYVQKCLSANQRKKYWFFLKVQRWSFGIVLAYIPVRTVVDFALSK